MQEITYLWDFDSEIHLPDVFTFLVVLLVVETAAICAGLVERGTEDSLVEVDFIKEALILADRSLFLDSCNKKNTLTSTEKRASRKDNRIWEILDARYFRW